MPTASATTLLEDKLTDWERFAYLLKSAVEMLSVVVASPYGDKPFNASSLVSEN